MMIPDDIVINQAQTIDEIISPATDEDELAKQRKLKVKTTGGVMKFPGVKSKSTSLEECMRSGQQFCEDHSVELISNEFIESILGKPENQMFMKFFRDPNDSKTAIQNRFGSRPQGVVIPLCETRQSVTYPTYARDFNGEYSAIINNNNYKQPVHLEICTSSEVNPYWQPVNHNHKIICSQVYQTYQLLGPANENEQTFNLKTFDVPSLCKIDFIKVN